MAENCLLTPLESALDYLTVTGRRTEARRDLKDVGHSLIRELEADGHDRRPFQWKGYLGEACAWATWGEREDGTMLRISGPWSSEYFDTVYPMADNVSRIDLAVTARAVGDDGDLAGQAFRSASAAASLRGKPLKVSYVCSNSGGSTVYLGSRLSDLFGRLYNKSAESGLAEYSECWRWEIEVKGKSAKHYADNIASATNRPGLILASVGNYFARRGVEPRFDAGNWRAIRPLPLEKSDDQRRLKWLQAQVAPVVHKMSGRVDRTTLLSTLGFIGENIGANGAGSHATASGAGSASQC